MNTNKILENYKDLTGKRKTIVLISGKKGCGKSTLSNELKKRVWATRINFADAVKELADPMLLAMHGSKAFLPENKELMCRKVYQAVGNSGRDVNPNFWIDKVKDVVKKSYADIIIIDDARFPNELMAFENEGYRIVKIRTKRDSIFLNVDLDESETSMDVIGDEQFDFISYGIEDEETMTKIVKKIKGEWC